jgi:hypothetical protein
MYVQFSEAWCRGQPLSAAVPRKVESPVLDYRRDSRIAREISALHECMRDGENSRSSLDERHLRVEQFTGRRGNHVPPPFVMIERKPVTLYLKTYCRHMWIRGIKNRHFHSAHSFRLSDSVDTVPGYTL